MKKEKGRGCPMKKEKGRGCPLEEREWAEVPP